MFSKSSIARKGEVCAYRLGGPDAYVRAFVEAGKVKLAQVGLNGARSLKDLPLSAKKHVSVLLLGPEAYAFGLVPTPLALGGTDKVLEAVKWAFAKDSDVDMENAVCEFLHVQGSETGGALLKDSHWVFAIEPARLASLMKLCSESRLKIEVVDTVATAQRNLCYSEVRHGASREGGYASIVVGEESSSINIASWTGDLLFHKQMEWSASALQSLDAKERLLVDLQRNLGYFERRLASFALVRGVVFGRGAEELAAYLTRGLGSFDWAPAAYPEVDFSLCAGAHALGGDDALLIGSLMRWA